MVLIDFFATLLLGVFAGSLLTEAFLLVPYWRRMPATDFIALHGTLGPSLYRFFAPLTTAAIMLALIAAVASGFDSIARNGAAVSSLATLAIYFGFFRTVNERFMRKEVSAADLPAVLRAWAQWHWVRTVLMCAAFALSLGAHRSLL